MLLDTLRGHSWTFSFRFFIRFLTQIYYKGAVTAPHPESFSQKVNTFLVFFQLSKNLSFEYHFIKIVLKWTNYTKKWLFFSYALWIPVLMINMLEHQSRSAKLKCIWSFYLIILVWYNNTTVWSYGREGDTTLSSFRYF